MGYEFAALSAEYIADFNVMRIVPGRAQAIEAAARKIVANRARYAIVEKATSAPWFVIGLLHMREADFDFSTHLFNGDSLKKRTVHEPKGQPLAPEPPYAWEVSAVAAIRFDGLDRIAQWTVASLAFAAEKYNGFGPRNHDRKSGYLWAGSTIYDGGKYVVDGHWEPDAVDTQLGVMAVLDELLSLSPDIAAALSGSPRPVSAEPVPIDLADAKASLPAHDAKAVGGFGLFVAVMGAGTAMGLPTMLFVAALVFGAVAVALWHYVTIRQRLDHLQAVADPVQETAPAAIPDPAAPAVSA